MVQSDNVGNETALDQLADRLRNKLINVALVFDDADTPFSEITEGDRRLYRHCVEFMLDDKHALELYLSQVSGVDSEPRKPSVDKQTD